MRRIVLDIDDVLNSLSLHIMQHFGCDVGPFEYAAFPTEVGYNVQEAVIQLGGDAPIHPSDFWDEVTQADLWRSAPKSPQCDWLIEHAASIVGKEEVILATTPTIDAVSHGHKVEWIWENLPSWIHRQYDITPRKWNLGKPGVILFDDHPENCKKFIKEGGEALLVPRPWNPDHELDTDNTILGRLNQLERIHV